MVKQLSILALGMFTACVLLSRPCPAEDAHRRIGGLVVVAVDSATVSSSIEGRVESVQAVEGDDVSRDQCVISLNDSEADLRHRLAKSNVQIAVERSGENRQTVAAEIALREAKQLLDEFLSTQEINQRKAENDLSIRAAEKAESVAQNELERAQKARANFSDSISESEIDALELAYQNRQLETRQARFEHSLAQLDVAAGKRRIDTLRTRIDAAEQARIESASLDRILRWQAEIEQHQERLASLHLKQHRLTSPITGTLVSVSVQAGDWIDQGQTVARVVNLQRLRAEGFIPFADVESLRRTSNLNIKIQVAGGETVTVKPTRQFISPEIDPITQETRVWFEFPNPERRIKPGLSAMLMMGAP
ncbi:efflux RND transporter periplasmic adaptor subunit [Crateriforma spongiae]|uniref:efflux RND transporter periplasmic adaptor subunit n=1 Tax=Crateriforma spongiae TaxID=2724528 RepID=UPI001445D76F|nr:HlyD family efflux transporter periplasmic adaptor subunit [Crateriforma spongiae]